MFKKNSSAKADITRGRLSATTGLLQCSKESSNFDDEALTRNLPPGC
jgi:hypothetical protein